MIEKDDRRFFSDSERADLFLASNGKCAECGIELESGFQADHIIAHSKGGSTDALRNGQALCGPCNLKKSNKGENTNKTFNDGRWPSFFRDWQIEAAEAVLNEYAREQISMVNVATGAGKTIFGLVLANHFLETSIVDRVVIVSPSQNIRDGWIEPQCPDGGLPINILDIQHKENREGARENSDFQGLSLTYQQVYMKPKLQWESCDNKRTLVIFDEIHHLGTDQPWGREIAFAFEKASIKVGLTGTAWRDEGSDIPGTRYVDGKLYCVYTYSLERAVREGVNRFPRFIAIDGSLRTQPTHPESCGIGERPPVKLSEERNDGNKSIILNALLDPKNDWIPSVLKRADDALMDIRTGRDFRDPEKATEDAKGLVIVRTKEDARQVQKQIERITYDKVALVISDEPESKNAINDFREGKLGRWAVAINMFSEGVNVPAIHIVVYATNITTPVRFNQIVGRALRRRTSEFNRAAIIFIPAIQELIILASNMEAPLLASFQQQMEEDEKRKKEEEDKDYIFDEDKDEDNDEDNDNQSWYSTSEGELHSFIEPLYEGDKSITIKAFNMAMAWCEHEKLFNMPEGWILDVARQKFSHGEQWTPPNDSSSSGSYKSQPNETNIKSRNRETKEARIAFNKAAGIKAKNLGIDYDIMGGYLKRFWPVRDKVTLEEFQRAKDYVENLSSSDIAELRKWQAIKDAKKAKESK